MENWSTLKAAIASVIKTNGNQEITGAVLQNTLNSIISTVGENATFVGIATPATNPGSPDGPVFYFANNAGVYDNFDGIELENPGFVVLYNLNGTWKSSKVYECLQELGGNTQFPVSQKLMSSYTTDFISNTVLDYSETGNGYIKAIDSSGNIKFGAFGSHNIYRIDAGTPFAVYYKNACGDAYGFAVIEDETGKVINWWITGQFQNGLKFIKQKKSVTIYASVVNNLKVYIGETCLQEKVSDIDNSLSNAYKSILMNGLEVSDYTFISGTKIDAYKNGALGVKFTKEGVSYSIYDNSIGKIFIIEKNALTANSDYVYCSKIYPKMAVPEFANVVLLDDEDNVVCATYCKSNLMMIPRNYKCIIMGASASECYINCRVKSNSEQMQENYENSIKYTDTNTTNLRIGIEISGEKGENILFNNKVGRAVKFGRFGTHTKYSIIGGETYRLQIKDHNGDAYDYLFADKDDIVLKVIKSGNLDFSNGKAVFNFSAPNNAVYLYACYSPIVNKLDSIKIVDYLNNFSSINTPLSLDGETYDGYVKIGAVGSAVTFGSFSSHKEIPIDNTMAIKLKFKESSGSGNAYAYAIVDSENTILEIISSQGANAEWEHVFGIYSNASKLMLSLNGTYSLYSIKTVSLQEKVSDIDTNIEELQEKVSDIDSNNFENLNFACDGDSMTTSWVSPMNNKVGFKSTNSNAMGNAMACDRSSSTSGTTYYPQWAPDAGDSFIDYFGLSDPNYTESGEGKYQRGTAEFDQATANNCLYGHLGRFIKFVSDGKYPQPDVFVLNLMGVNDTWSTEEIQNVIGNFDEVITGAFDKADCRNSILGALRWYVTLFRKTFPQCNLFFKTSSQQNKENHTHFYDVYEPVLKLMRYLSVPVIDSYGEIGIMADLEHAGELKAENIWTSDGTHPTSAGYKRDGEFVASKIKCWFL